MILLTWLSKYRKLLDISEKGKHNYLTLKSFTTPMIMYIHALSCVETITLFLTINQLTTSICDKCDNKWSSYATQSYI